MTSAVPHIRQLVQNYGSNSNSFLTLYEGFKYFQSSNPQVTGTIAYADTPHAWVGATEPLAAPEQQIQLLQEFAAQAQAHGKKALLLPINKTLAQRARKLGFNTVMIGSEPTFVLDQYEPNLDLIQTAKTLSKKGACIQEFRPDQLTPEQKKTMDLILQSWIDSRKTAPLRFLNTVAPWTLAEDKKYFLIEFKGQILAFLSAIPIWTRQGWYLIDLIRHPDSPAGTTELLILEAMSLLKKQGAKEITLGVAPLSNLHLASHDGHSSLYKILNFVYEKGNYFYNFKPLYQFKLKFQPSHNAPMFLIYHPQKLGLRGILGLVDAFFEGGTWQAATSGLQKILERFDLKVILRKIVHSEIIIRSAAPSFWRLLERCKFSVSMGLVNIWFFAAFLYINDEQKQIWAYWPQELFTKPWLIASASVLHFEWIHFAINTVIFLLFTASLEYLAGTPLTALSYISAALLANPLTTVLFIWPTKLLAPHIWQYTLTQNDIGASLGILGSAGALSIFIKYGKYFLMGIIVFSIIQCLLSGNPLTLNHGLAAIIGFFMAKIFLKT